MENKKVLLEFGAKVGGLVNWQGRVGQFGSLVVKFLSSKLFTRWAL